MIVRYVCSAAYRNFAKRGGGGGGGGGVNWGMEKIGGGGGAQ